MSRSLRLRPRRATRWTALVAVCAVVLVAGACSDDSSDDASSTTKAPATTAAEASPAASAVTDNAVTVETPGMAFDVSGPLRPGVATITLKNTSDDTHMMALAPMKPGVTLDQVKTALATDGDPESSVGPLLATPPEQAVFGTPGMVAGGHSSTVTSKDLPAGDYVLICFLTDATGTPHFQMGMIGELKVEGEKATDEPTSDGTITLDDKAITLPDGFDGHGTFLVTNSGSSPHSISFAQLEDGTTLEAFYQFTGEAMNSGKSIDGGGGKVAGGVDSLLPGQSAYLTIDLDAGHYGYLSTDDANGPDMPAQHGELDVD
jgi:hypothetical protein